jgi:hypothetical protein
LVFIHPGFGATNQARNGRVANAQVSRCTKYGQNEYGVRSVSTTRAENPSNVAMASPTERAISLLDEGIEACASLIRQLKLELARA